MKNCWRFFLILSPLLMIKSQAQDPDKFSAAEVKADFKYLYETLEASHYNLYANTPKRKFEKEFKQINASIKDSLTFLQINRLFQPFTALSKLGHCNAGYPFKSYNAFLKKKGRIFPFDVKIEDRRIFVADNYSNDSTIQAGDIYGVRSMHWVDGLYRYLSGENETFKNTLVNLVGFPRLFWMVFGENKMFSVKLKKSDGQIIFVNDEGILASKYRDIRNQKPSVLNSNRDFKVIGKIAYLQPGQFLNNKSSGISSPEASDKGEFLHFIDSSFLQIHKMNIKDLILDLRNNPGGNSTFSDPMIAYFAKEPFSFTSAFYVKTSKPTKEFWKNVNDTSLTKLKNEILTRKDGEVFEADIQKYTPRMDSSRFAGNVYVLINKYSYSNAATSAAIIQDYNFGTLIGEQTVESPTLYASVHEFILPITKITVTYPKALIIRSSGDKSIKGVVPDFRVSENPLTSADDPLEWTIKHITSKSSPSAK